mmetsp:Transcript_13302/g.19902  ORF Transcript_13302/g.19902 Transcript_13302/m.19902 type:complete len:310 (+) Transcript_13302:160-1089(+)|eukprot:CAMPEP_0167752702 /NCGR_PEP_ID=MMETSP0110_2-20121227/7288_1 /TAXON_ID=629695 /ORGANISM="Gymnochlora sp., Strain CCMP2014" /LENGTH=309 /DNA_ID=CAMNT_0007638353 /DNA_START=49 /DNA_END=978 /DNA_ORIENTATION=+
MSAGDTKKLLNEAEKKVYEGEYKNAVTLLESILKANPRNLDALDLYAKAATDSGKEQMAIKILKRAISFDPKTAHRWMDLGQLQSGPTALKCFRQGISVMEANLMHAMKNAPLDFNLKDSLRMEIASGYASVADLFVTDLCDETHAERECEKALKLALNACEKSLEAHYGCANLRLIQGRRKEAVMHTRACNQILEEKKVGEVSPALRMSIAEICLELGETTHAAEMAEVLLQEDDRIVQSWYFAALCYFAAEDMETTTQYLKRAVDMLKKSPQKDLMTACQDLYNQMRRKKGQMNNHVGKEDNKMETE